MFAKFEKTVYSPKLKPVLVWDGECGFCKFWIIRLKTRTEDRIDFKTYQDVADSFPDIPLKEFKKASRLIETNGSVYSGPDSLYRGLEHSKKPTRLWHRWYVQYNFFTKLSDYGYNIIAKNRPFMFTSTKLLFGKNPKRFKLYWLVYIMLIVALLTIAFN
ncbi:hypothetical protein LCGC14_0665920 [marine sediment metagenome]|uniref:DUF393 domain-containing protein n=2 Tax=root TaxID=1 RepID=A0A831QR82_9FLAO|nr:DUF393 domain-containing protein [Pricia antarctica]